MVKVAFVIGAYPPEQRRLREEAALRYASPEVEVGILSVLPAPFDGLGPAEMQLAAPHFHAAFIAAEEQGYDAVVPLGMLDLGIDGGRAQVDIPVIAPFQASLHVAAQLGDRIGVVCYNKEGVMKTRVLASNYRLDSFVVGWRAGNFRLRDIQANKQQMIDDFLASARSLIEEDEADVIIPAGITQCPVQMRPEWLCEQLGVPVVEGIGAPIRLAAMFAHLGLKHSRIRWPKSTVRPNL